MRAGVGVPSVDQQIIFLEALLPQVDQCESIYEQIECLDSLAPVQEYLREPSAIRTFLAGLNPECEYVIKAILAMGQGPLVFDCPEDMPEKFEKLRQLLNRLIEIENFYEPIGGLLGYQLTLLRLIQAGETLEGEGQPAVCFTRPGSLDLSQDNLQVREAICWGIEHLGEMGEIYPVGGAGDRLALVDEGTGRGLPAATLSFGGISLLEGMFRDLQAREYLHFKLYGKQIRTPVAMMTSDEKENHGHILAICEKANWFGRPKEAFRFFKQPCVPVVTVEGAWCTRSSLELVLKPGGHGVMWLLAKQSGTFDWFQEQGRGHVLVRQINNPVADTDGGTLGFTGLGLRRKKAFGFASCSRLLHTAEGVNVLREKQEEDGWHYTFTNIEYTEFPKFGLRDTPARPESPYSEYPSNTNILFAGLEAVKEALKRQPIPGKIVNMKSQFPSWVDGKETRVRAGRLESTMQNIADAMEDVRPNRLDPEEADQLSTYVTSNRRRKTISVTKRSYEEGRPLEETPEGCFVVQQQNYRELLKQYCEMTLPELRDGQSYVRGELPFLIRLHPALGPLYSVIGQKIRGGSLSRGSELQLDLAEVDLLNLQLDGSLLVRATSPMGQPGSDGYLNYSHSAGRCRLKNCRVENLGIDIGEARELWRNQIPRKQSLMITLHEDAEFEAEDITLRGHHHFDVPKGHRLTLLPHTSGFESRLTKIQRPSWYWAYRVDGDYRIRLERREA